MKDEEIEELAKSIVRGVKKARTNDFAVTMVVADLNYALSKVTTQQNTKSRKRSRDK